MTFLNQIGLANPGTPIYQQEIARFMRKAHGLDEYEGRKLDFLYRKSGIDTRYSVLRDFDKEQIEDYSFFPKTDDLEPFPGTKERMEVFAKEAPDLAERAVRECLAKGPISPSELTHLILVSCTGMLAPGVELTLMNKLGINPQVERYCIHFMGCYAAFSGIKLADKILRAEPKAQVLLVSVELCTLHFQKVYNEDNLLANSLFGDGAAAALLSNRSEGFAIQDYTSHLISEGAPDMAWSIGDFGFEMALSKYVPQLLQDGIGKFKDAFESKFKLSQISNFAIHPGGKQILQKVQEAFGFSEDCNRQAMEVLRNFGNMSSATILFVLQAMMKDDSISGEILAMGFGPGLTLETLMLQKT
ncbi:type III polyketide synthase [Algoriphagus kandeliae]|uniref:Type III polyketide synthase n=1 Tax=Algoriphagus kandeliae TaxID=2562278 RepID=A0A4Y9QX46_9BACT|nr:type III polyketide synthase [Algoriphagus kandeliae]TFV95505.1 type III polyketide synthase [Algoriphagus kandeliae]